jgi:hypothetical protein
MLIAAQAMKDFDEHRCAGKEPLVGTTSFAAGYIKKELI